MTNAPPPAALRLQKANDNARPSLRLGGHLEHHPLGLYPPFRRQPVAGPALAIFTRRFGAPSGLPCRIFTIQRGHPHAHA